MTGYTRNYSLPFPEGNDRVAVHTDIENLARAVDANIEGDISVQGNRLTSLTGMLDTFKNNTEHQFDTINTVMLPRDEASEYGIEGPRGPAPHIFVGNTTQVDAGEPASLTVTEVSAGQYRIDAAIPRGPGGDGQGAEDDAVASHINTAGTATRQALDRNFGSTIMVVGAAGDGATNDSGPWQNAIDEAADAGGGVVTAPRGKTYIVEGLTLRSEVILDLDGITLQLPESGNLAMFKAPEGRFDRGGFIGGTLNGVDKTRHGVDFWDATIVHEFRAEGILIQNFDHGVRGSYDDRWPHWHGCRFWYNNVGMFIQRNHPILDVCDFRRNDIGVTGDINDWFALNTKFNYNRIGILGDGDGRVDNSWFIGCGFFRNTELGISLGTRNLLLGCTFVGINNNDTGIRLAERGNRIQAGYFGMFTQSEWSFGNAAIVFDPHSTSGMDNTLIEGNWFQISEGVGITATTRTPSAIVNALTVANNTVRLRPEPSFIDLPIRADNFLINGNNISSDANPELGTPVVNMPVVQGYIGGSVTNNLFSSFSANQRKAIHLNSSSGSLIANNKFRNFPDALELSHPHNTHLNGNVGYANSSRGNAQIPAGSTEVAVEHGLDVAPRTQNVQLTPMSRSPQWWLANVNDTTFTIRMAETSPSQQTWAWQIEVSAD